MQSAYSWLRLFVNYFQPGMKLKPKSDSVNTIIKLTKSTSEGKTTAVGEHERAAAVTE